MRSEGKRVAKLKYRSAESANGVERAAGDQALWEAQAVGVSVSLEMATCIMYNDVFDAASLPSDY